LTTDLKRDAATTVMRRADEADEAELDALFTELERTGAEELAAEGLTRDRVAFQRKLDVRYVGQSFELTIPAGPDLLERFHAQHERTYGFAAPGEPVEIVSIRLTSIGRIDKPPVRSLAAGEAPPARAYRPVYFAESGGYVDCAIHERGALPAGARLDGPVVVEELDSTTVVHPGFTVRVDGMGNLHIEKEHA
jgi:N-methylhydantoinase A